VNQPDLQSVAILVAALAFVLAVTAIQRLLGRILTRRDRAESPSVPPASKRGSVRRPVGTDEALGRDVRMERGDPERTGPPHPRRSPALATRRRARQILREPGGRKAAILAREILGPARGLSGPTGPR
jgi:hypothetical protein